MTSSHVWLSLRKIYFEHNVRHDWTPWTLDQRLINYQQPTQPKEHLNANIIFSPGCLKCECESSEDFPTLTVVSEFVE